MNLDSFDPFAVSGRSEDDLIKIKCMGTPMIIPLQFAIKIPLIKLMIETNNRKLSEIVPFQGTDSEVEINLDVPITMFSRMYEAMFSNFSIQKGSVSREEADYFLFDIQDIKRITQPSDPDLKWCDKCEYYVLHNCRYCLICHPSYLKDYHGDNIHGRLRNRSDDRRELKRIKEYLKKS